MSRAKDDRESDGEDKKNEWLDRVISLLATYLP